MKIRMGFVSNSSSSSFLVAYKNFEDFVRFSLFNGFEIFIEDMKKTKDFDKNVKKFIVKKLDDYFCYHYYDISSSEEIYEKMDEICGIFDFTNISFIDENGPFEKIFEKFNNLKKEFWNFIEKNNSKLFEFIEPIRYSQIDVEEIVLRYADDDERMFWVCAVNDYHKKCEEFYYSDEFKKSIENVTDKLIEEFKKSGVKLKFLRYEDDTHDGYMMENEFMPFMAKDPENKVRVFQIYEH